MFFFYTFRNKDGSRDANAMELIDLVENIGNKLRIPEHKTYTSVSESGKNFTHSTEDTPEMIHSGTHYVSTTLSVNKLPK